MTEDTNLNKCDSNDTLIAEVPEVNETATDLNSELMIIVKEEEDAPKVPASEEIIVPACCGNRGDFASLVRNLLGPIYGDSVMNLLIRQARDILVCAYHGNLENFVRTYLSPAAVLLAEVKNVASETGNEAVVPEGWPLTLGGNGLILQLGELEASALRLGECYLCVRSAAAATATAITSSVSGATTAGEAVEQNTVEIAVVWRTTSMRAPGILGWDREDEFMDWRDLTNKGQPSSSNTSTNLSGAQPSSVMKTTGRPRRRSREDARPRTREINKTNSAEHRREEARSIDRLEHQFCRENHTIGESGHTVTVMKSRSASSVNTWKDDLDGDEDELDRSTSCRVCSKNSSSPIGGDESRAKVKRCTKVVSPTTMEKWKESSRCEMRSRSIASENLKSPLQFEESILRRDDIADDSPKDLEDRLRNAGGPDDISDEDLPAYIGSLLVTVERKIERVSLDDMTFPCPACRNIDTDDPLLGCRCAGDDCGCGEDNCDCSSSASRKEQSAKSFEVAGIKHIDSDDEEEVRMGFGTKKRVDEVASPRTIHDLPEHVLTCGLSLPGYSDVAGRPVIEFEDNVSTRETLSIRETSSFLLYLARLPSSDCTKNGFTIFIRGDSKESLEFIDEVVVLLQGRINVAQTLVLRNAATKDGLIESLLPLSKVQTVIVNDATLAKYIPRREENHDQMQWITFYKEYDSLMTEWQSAGRRLALEMSDLKECTSLSGTLTPLGRLLTDPTLRRTSRDAEEAIAALEERAAPLLHIEHVRLSVKRARRLVEEVGKAATRLESSFESRRATIRNLAVLRSIEDQAHEVLSWLCKKGEDILSKHAQHIATNLTSARLHEREFEKFYFTSMARTAKTPAKCAHFLLFLFICQRNEEITRKESRRRRKRGRRK
ncbi:PREDICTED: uncharacterized protein LOC108686058 [Atta colombica]|uniref:uncharacterized protein LOC108686058 n=1 Tax=Atta colombica TaxID=520822 RepID=UPI00084CD0F7|nr:PREDICTED: uncharacterized protein LOC108686058 [Atta colombica]